MEDEIFKIGFPSETVHEGKTKIRVPRLEAFVNSPSEYAPSKAPVFFNPAMELNRDIAVLALQAYQRMLNREISVCEPLSGCGIRGIRFASEVEGIERVIINDISVKAFQLTTFNMRMNRLSKQVLVKNKDANLLLGSYGAPRKRFDAIDLDPFGSPVPYLDSALRALRNKGLLALTATDMGPLCGVHPKACIRKYGGKPLRTEYCHELAVRLLSGKLAMTAAEFDMGIDIVFSHSADHYIRIYATARSSAKKADDNIKNMGYVLHCFKCLHRETLKDLFETKSSDTCVECGSRISLAGPLWLGRIVEEQFCKAIEEEVKRRMFKLGERIRKTLTLIKGETEAPITYYTVDKLCDKLSLPMPSIRIVLEALREEGFQASLTHFNPQGIRSNVSATRMKEILLEKTGK